MFIVKSGKQTQTITIKGVVKMFKKMLSAGVAMVMALSLVSSASAQRGDILFVNTNELTEEMLWERDGELIVEVIDGQCLNDEGDGIVFGTGTYISYRGVDGVKSGDVIRTYCIYNPDTHWTDDIVIRVDKITYRP